MFKKKIFSIVLTIFIVVLFDSMALAATIALTSAGQSPDAMMVKVILKKMNVEADFDMALKPDAIKDHKALIIVVGGSSKGLGAAGIDQDQEKTRVEKS